MLTTLQYRILKALAGTRPEPLADSDPRKSKLDTLFGRELVSRIVGRLVIDFGCGDGLEAIDLARRGAKRVIGIDNREEILQVARANALRAGVSDCCTFVSSTMERADIILSIDAFEHFADPAAILRTMDTLLLPHGEVLISFGPPWYHPLGGHLFSVFPWAHIIFTEEALIRWRSTIRSDGATRFSEVSGGLNQMTIRKFESLLTETAFQVRGLEFVPIRKLRHVHNPLTREFTTAIVRAHLLKSG